MGKHWIEFDLKDIDLKNFSESDVDEFIKHPFWQHLIEYAGNALANRRIDLEDGDIVRRAQMDDTVLFRTNDMLRGSILELKHFLAYPQAIKEDILIQKALDEVAIQNKEGDTE